MTQRFVIRLLPLEVLLMSILAGWLVITEAHWVDAAPHTALAAAPVAAAPLAAPTLPALFTPEVQHWAGQITAWAALYQLDPALVATVMQIESCGNPQAVSPSGARGLFQVMPFHFAPKDDMLDPDTNAARGLTYLALGLARGGGNAGLALAGYNGGHSLIGVASSLWPAQTQSYWYWGSGIYADAAQGQPTSPRLQAWLQAGGASLCAKAAQVLGLGR
jgi:soluble lytic murein transglycosylase-like protein